MFYTQLDQIKELIDIYKNHIVLINDHKANDNDIMEFIKQIINNDINYNITINNNICEINIKE